MYIHDRPDNIHVYYCRLRHRGDPSVRGRIVNIIRRGSWRPDARTSGPRAGRRRRVRNGRRRRGWKRLGHTLGARDMNESRIYQRHRQWCPRQTRTLREGWRRRSYLFAAAAAAVAAVAT